eukprot:CAMPEP_0171926966 /NCGR_PEP_ID=MMETSP0993-20121228/25352_1 /TAXON_ID=483369 /ORGANISM="non described non described, Strain CCMP2098" /LENGTH=106 /DNA_ID=CAMNT_0012565893 /DNA_START=45 /DNA_END=362 /DNA_ORIENTATION=+
MGGKEAVEKTNSGSSSSSGRREGRVPALDPTSEVCRKLREVFKAMEKCSADPCSVKKAEGLAEMLSRQTKGLPEALSFVASEFLKDQSKLDAATEPSVQGGPCDSS